MHSEFQKYILDEIEELGEFPCALLVPKFLEIEKGKRPKKVPIGSDPENYDIEPGDLLFLKNQLLELFSDMKIGLFKYLKVKENIPKSWEDSFELIDREKTQKIFHDDKFWLFKEKEPAYFIASISDET